MDENLNNENLETDLFIDPGQIVQKVEEVYKNERFSPEILPHSFHFTSILIDQIKRIVFKLLNFGKRNRTGNPKNAITFVNGVGSIPLSHRLID